MPLRTTGGLETVGMRCPDHAVTRAIIEASGVPVAAPSANTSGRPSCTTAEHVREDMWGKIDGIVDGGPCQVGVESTIIALTVTPPQLLRPGGLPLESLRDALGEVTVDKAVTQKMNDGEKPRAPGMKYRHYAPKAPVTVVTGSPRLSLDAATLYDEVVAADGERLGAMLAAVLLHPRDELLRVHAGNAGRRLEQALARGVLAAAFQEQANRFFNFMLVNHGIQPSITRMRGRSISCRYGTTLEPATHMPHDKHARRGRPYPMVWVA